MEYWRLLFHKITIEDIKKFEETYKGSEEEKDTVKTVYLEKEGDMEAILEQVCRFVWFSITLAYPPLLSPLDHILTPH